MANRHTLPARLLDEFKSWLTSQGWKIEEPRGDWEVLRARSAKRIRPLILWKRLQNNGGGELTHLTADDRDMDVIHQFLRERKTQKNQGENTLHWFLRYVQESGVSVTFSRGLEYDPYSVIVDFRKRIIGANGEDGVIAATSSLPTNIIDTEYALQRVVEDGNEKLEQLMNTKGMRDL